ncbi:MAG: biosynthetic-type acetolactate synthase large subunit [Coriobacteriia bacterium]|nr:biosynthetic-type acetolactate synthase large subunit [Coriobacteriia bacterium]
MKLNGATALVRALEDLGVKHIFGLPGVQNSQVYDALLDSPIEHVLVRHEQAAVHMADGYARATGGTGVVLVTSGPGATNTVTGIATAYMDSVPVVVITGQVPTTAMGTDAFQEADITTITLPITKHSYLLGNVDELVPSVFEAFYLASSGRPGPVLIDIPLNVAAGQALYKRPAAKPSLPSYKPTIKGNARQVKAAAELIVSAAKPVLLAGGGVVSSGASEALVSLAEQNGIPVVSTLLAKGAIASDHPLYGGQPGVYGTIAANTLLQEADVVIAVGTKFSERITGNATEFAPQAQIIHIDIDPAEIGKNIRVDIPIVGDANVVLAALLERLGTCGASAGRITGKKDKQSCSSPAPDNTTHQVFSVLNQLLSERQQESDVIITTDVGQHQLWASHLIDVDIPRRFLTSGGLGTMGFGLPAALGAQLAYPEALVLCISGDGSFQMNLQEMATAIAQKLPIKVAIINNESLGLVRQYQELFLGQRVTQTHLEALPNYVRLAGAYGWQGKSLCLGKLDQGSNNQADDSSIKEAFSWLIESVGPALLEIVVPTEDLLTPFVKPGGSLLEVVEGA